MTGQYLILDHGRLQSHLPQCVICNESNPVTVIRHSLANVKDGLLASLQTTTPVILYYLIQNAYIELIQNFKN